MSILSNERVPLPDKKITFKKGKNGTLYVYYTVRSYRNAKGKPTSDEVIIGKMDPLSGMLIPNTRYFEIYGKPAPQNTVPRRIEDYGNYLALNTLAEECGLMDILKECFPQCYQELLACAFYMVCEGNVMMYLEDWSQNTYTTLTKALTSQRASELFSKISMDDRMKFFTKWIRKRMDNEYIAYDVTSISTYSQGNTLAEWGYNRDNEKLPQINLGMFFGESSKLPVFYNTYSGSIADKSHLQFMMEYTAALGIGKVRYVMDKGFITAENLAFMKENDLKFVVCLPNSRTKARDWIDQAIPSIRTSANWLSEYEVYAVCMEQDLDGVKVNAHVYFDPDKCADEERSIYAYVNRLEDELEKMESKSRISKRYTDFFDVEATKGNLSYNKNVARIDSKLRHAGYFIFITTDMQCTSEEVIAIYRNKDLVEKSFDNIKNDLDFRRLKTHLNATTDGKLFVGFLALILRTGLQNRIWANESIRKLTIKKLLIELRKIKLITLPDNTKVFMPLTKLQKQILATLKVTSDDLGKVLSGG